MNKEEQIIDLVTHRDQIKDLEREIKDLLDEDTEEDSDE